MTSTAALDPPPPEGGGPRQRWTAARRAGINCGRVHGRDAPGYLDESARRLSHEEYLVAALLASEGHAVRALAESRDGGRTPDLMACDSTVEVKSFLPIDARHGRAPSPRSVLNKLIDAAGQADSAVLLARRSGLTAASASRGVRLYVTRSDGRVLDSVRVIGDGFDLSWVHHLDVSGSRSRIERSGPHTGL